MKRFVLHTARYEKWVREKFDVQRSEKCGSDYALYIAWEGGIAALTRGLTELLETAAMLENPVYRCSPRMRTLARGLRDTAACGEDAERLRQFLRANKSLHIEGYIHFRMGRYIEMLDMLSYRLIKKMRLHAKGDWL
jgi:hypothetical protein